MSTLIGSQHVFFLVVRTDFFFRLKAFNAGQMGTEFIGLNGIFMYDLPSPEFARRQLTHNRQLRWREKHAEHTLFSRRN